jgi:hypothetical protein
LKLDREREREKERERERKRERERERGGCEAATSSLLASHAMEHNHQVIWEEVTILAKESKIRKRKIHAAALQ